MAAGAVATKPAAVAIARVIVKAVREAAFNERGKGFNNFHIKHTSFCGFSNKRRLGLPSPILVLVLDGKALPEVLKWRGL